jgi:phosphopantothenoylcysteine decarboxylase
MSRAPRVLLGLSGSVACIKAVALVHALLRQGHEVRVILTRAATHFVTATTLNAVCPRVAVYTDECEWMGWTTRGDPVLHIELRKWADVLVIAPLSANTLAKLAAGLSDNLLTCVVRAWDLTRPVLLAPAMNTLMYSHPHTAQHLQSLTALGMRVVAPVSKALMCGDVGSGAMADVETIVQRVSAAVAADALTLVPAMDAPGCVRLDALSCQNTKSWSSCSWNWVAGVALSAAVFMAWIARRPSSSR